MTAPQTVADVQSQREQAAVWSFRKGWRHRFGQSGVRAHVAKCLVVIREERAAATSARQGETK